jgi:hypothetical protein
MNYFLQHILMTQLRLSQLPRAGISSRLPTPFLGDLPTRSTLLQDLNIDLGDLPMNPSPTVFSRFLICKRSWSDGTDGSNVAATSQGLLALVTSIQFRQRLFQAPRSSLLFIYAPNFPRGPGVVCGAWSHYCDHLPRFSTVPVSPAHSLDGSRNHVLMVVSAVHSFVGTRLGLSSHGEVLPIPNSKSRDGTVHRSAAIRPSSFYPLSIWWIFHLNLTVVFSS